MTVPLPGLYFGYGTTCSVCSTMTFFLVQIILILKFSMLDFKNTRHCELYNQEFLSKFEISHRGGSRAP